MVGIDRNKFNPLKAIVDHTVYGIAACASDSYNLDLGNIGSIVIYLKL